MKKHQRVNLIPKTHAAPPAFSVDKMILGSIFVTVIGCATHFYFGIKTVSRLEAEMKAITEKNLAIDRQTEEATKMITASAVAGEQEKLIRQVIGTKPNWSDAFKELSLVIPQETWLSQLVLKNNAGQIAVSIRGETSSQANMADFLSSLEKSEFFNNILMISSKISQTTNPPLYSFEFAAPGLENTLKGQAAR